LFVEKLIAISSQLIISHSVILVIYIYEKLGGVNMSISDWIAFLLSVRDSAINTVLNVGAMLLAFVGLIYAEKTGGIGEALIYAIVVLLISVYVFYKIFSPIGKQERKANRILKKIIKGDLKTADEIKAEWLKK
jgi:hypothetical protein